MAALGITGKRIRKKPKYLREEEYEEVEEPIQKFIKPTKPKKQKKEKQPSQKQSFRDTNTDKPKHALRLKIKLGAKKSTSRSADVSRRDRNPSGSNDSEDSENIDIEVDDMSSSSPPGASTADNKSQESDLEESPVSDDNTRTSKAQGGDGDETSDEEREWLNAIETGEIETYEKKRAEKNPALLTARQRRLLHGEEEEQLIELPSAYKNKELTEEQLLVRKQRAIKRRQQAIEKNEKAKKQTVDRLLKKSDTASSKTKAKVTKLSLPHYRLVSSHDSLTLLLPADVPFPITAQSSLRTPEAVICSVEGCRNVKKYSCSRTKVPLCSLQCFKRNLDLYHSMTASA